MPRVHQVAAARQRYERVPVIDPATGEQKTVAVNRRPGRSGRPVVQRLTTEDRAKPLPPYRCDMCPDPIAVGTPYKYIDIKQQRGGITRRRHVHHPNWQPWEYSSALWARIAQIQAMDVDVSGLEAGGDPAEYVSDIVEAIRELASEKEEGASNIESGFGHETEQSTELREASEQLESWADEFESIAWPDEPEAEEEDCAECGGTGEVEGEPVSCSNCGGLGGVGLDVCSTCDGAGEIVQAESCEECDGTGQITGDEPTEDQLAEWREAVEAEIQSALENAPSL